MMAGRVRVEPRGQVSTLAQVAPALLSLAGAGAVGAVLLAATGHDPWEAYGRMVTSSFDSELAIARTLLSATPLVLVAVATAVAFRMHLWNVGGEGQLYLGAIAAAGTAIVLGDGVPAAVALPLVLAAGAVAGGLWAGLAALPRARFGTDEIISTLMLNFVALHLMNYLIFGSVSMWRDQESLGWASGRLIPEVAQLPRVWSRLHAGFLVAIAAVALFSWLLRWSRWGFELRVVGDSPQAARYAGINVGAKVVTVLLVSGAVAGLGGAVLVSGTTHALQPNTIAVGLGYTGIVVAAVARLSPVAIVPVAVFLAGFTNASASMQTLGIPTEIVVLLEGTALLLVVAGEYLVRNRVVLSPRRLATEAT